jgi:DNA topoisomerase-1
LFFSLPKDVDPLTIELDRAAEIILAKRQSDSQKILQEFNDDNTLIQVLNGRFGAYIASNKNNYKIPKGKDPKSLTLSDCKAIIAETPPSKSKSKKKK